MSTDNHTIQFCCGTTCDAEENLAYVKGLERKLLTYQQAMARNATYINDLEELVCGLIEGDTKGFT